MKDVFKKIILERQERMRKINLVKRKISIENEANYAFTEIMNSCC